MNQGQSKTEHILVCISSAPSNVRIIRTAAEMARAYKGHFTALYVRTPQSDRMSAEDEGRLQKNIKFAESLGADISTVSGEDIAFMIFEFSRISKVTKVVIGRNNSKRRLFGREVLADRLTRLDPEFDIHIIPDSEYKPTYRTREEYLEIIPSLKGLGITLLVLIVASLIGFLFYELDFEKPNIITVYMLGVLIASLLTKNYICSAIYSLSSVLLFNFLFTSPQFKFAADTEHTVTFAIMFAAALFVGALSNKLQRHAKESATAAYRTKILFETNSRLQQANDKEEAINITANQLQKLLSRDIAIFDGVHSFRFLSDGKAGFSPSLELAQIAYAERKRCGRGTEKNPEDECLYIAISAGEVSYAVFAIYVGEKPIEPFLMSILLSLVGDCALTLEGIRNAKEKEAAAILMKNEQLRANLLRSISHDLRTPLTSIAGNAESLIRSLGKLDEETVAELLKSTYDDSIYLIDLVENLLSITRIGDGRLKLSLAPELMDEVLHEAVARMEKRSGKHKIELVLPDELLLCNMDARLITQVVINLIDNALKYSDGGTVTVSATASDKEISVSVADMGDGIDDSLKELVFAMFYSGKKSADGSRSIGLGLALCKSIIDAHGGEISVCDNHPKGAVFRFTLKRSEVNLNE